MIGAGQILQNHLPVHCAEGSYTILDATTGAVSKLDGSGSWPDFGEFLLTVVPEIAAS